MCTIEGLLEELEELTSKVVTFILKVSEEFVFESIPPRKRMALSRLKAWVRISSSKKESCASFSSSTGAENLYCRESPMTKLENENCVTFLPIEGSAQLDGKGSRALDYPSWTRRPHDSMVLEAIAASIRQDLLWVKSKFLCPCRHFTSAALPLVEASRGCSDPSGVRASSCDRS